MEFGRWDLVGPEIEAAAFRVVPKVMAVPYPDLRLLGTQPQVTEAQ